MSLGTEPSRGRERGVWYFHDKQGMEVDSVVDDDNPHLTLIEPKAHSYPMPNGVRSLVCLAAGIDGYKVDAFLVHADRSAPATPADLCPGVKAGPVQGCRRALRAEVTGAVGRPADGEWPASRSCPQQEASTGPGRDWPQCPLVASNPVGVSVCSLNPSRPSSPAIRSDQRAPTTFRTDHGGLCENSPWWRSIVSRLETSQSSGVASASTLNTVIPSRWSVVLRSRQFAWATGRLPAESTTQTGSPMGRSRSRSP